VTTAAFGERGTGALPWKGAHGLHARRAVDDAAFAAARETWGEHGVIELTALCGYYTLVALILNVAEMPVPEGSRVLAVLGSGVQAHAHVEALAHVADFGEIRVWSRTAEHAQQFARQRGATAMGAEAAVRDADVVVVATSSRQPVLRGEWLKPGAHVNAVGANRPDWRELDDDAMSATLFVDSRAAAAQESGDIMLSRAAIYAEIGELFANAVLAPPRSATTIFKSLGLAVEDLAAAKLVLNAFTR